MSRPEQQSEPAKPGQTLLLTGAGAAGVVIAAVVVDAKTVVVDEEVPTVVVGAVTVVVVAVPVVVVEAIGRRRGSVSAPRMRVYRKFRHKLDHKTCR